MTNPIKDYIKAVEKKLPGDRRSLVAAELVVQLKAQRDALEKTLGRKPNEDDLEKLVAGLSPPEQAAERYGAPKGPYDLLERYLMSVQRKLPLGVPSHDILAELREGLTARIEATQDASGRQITGEDIAGVLKAFGSPDIVAYSYRARPALIGPEVAPYFWTAQKAVIAIVLGIILFATVLDGLGTPRPVMTVLRAISRMWEGGIFTFGAVTLVFILADAWAPRFRLDKLWNPKFLPETSIRSPRSRFESLFALVFDAIFILWWIGVITLPQLDNPATRFELHLSDAWTPLYAPILALAILTAAVHFADIVHPGWSRLRAVVAIVGCIGGIVVVSLISRAPELVLAGGSKITPERAEQAAYYATIILRAGLIVMALIWAIEIGFEVWRLARSRAWRGMNGGPGAMLQEGGQ